MLNVCDVYARNMDISFNPAKTNCIYFPAHPNSLPGLPLHFMNTDILCVPSQVFLSPAMIFLKKYPTICTQFVCENSICSVYVGGYCGLSESGLCVFDTLCPVGFLVVCKCSMVLLQSMVMSYVDGGQLIVRFELSTMSGCIVC